MKNKNFDYSNYSNFLCPQNKDPILDITNSLNKKNRREKNLEEIISSIDEMQEMHDPYSEISLFLCKIIHDFIKENPVERKWTIKLQEELIARISPQFEKKFPSYRLGILSIKRTWEKLCYYLQQLDGKEIALNQDGSIDIDHLIKLRLSSYFKTRPYYTIQSYFFSQHLSSKICELCATLDRKIIDREHLTKKIWTIQKCLLIKEADQNKTPYDTLSDEESLIQDLAFTLLDQNKINAQDFKSKLSSRLNTLFQTLNDTNIETLYGLIAVRISLTLNLHKEIKEILTKQEIKSLDLTIRALDANQELSNFRRTSKCLIDLLNLQQTNTSPRSSAADILAFMTQLNVDGDSLKNISEKLTHFDSSCFVIIPSYLASCYEQEIKDSSLDDIIDEHIFYTYLSNPSYYFHEILEEVFTYLRKAKQVAAYLNLKNNEELCELASLQNDMIAQSSSFYEQSQFYPYIREEFSEDITKELIISSSIKKYLHDFPHLEIFQDKLKSKAMLCLKKIWYSSEYRPDLTALEKFILWHESPDYARKEKNGLEKLIPLFSFDDILIKEKVLIQVS